MEWDPLGLLGGGGKGTEEFLGGFLLGPLGFITGLLGGGGGSGSESGSGGSGSESGYGYSQQTPDVMAQIMPLFMLALVAFLVVKFLPKLLK
jgi:hypothetical protein